MKSPLTRQRRRKAERDYAKARTQHHDLTTTEKQRGEATAKAVAAQIQDEQQLEALLAKIPGLEMREKTRAALLPHLPFTVAEPAIN